MSITNDIHKSDNRVAYIYMWTHLPTGKWYLGSRTAKGCHPQDGYICSSKVVKPMITKNPTEWKREIIATGTREDIRNFESVILTALDAKHDSTSFNYSNADGATFTTAGRIEPEEEKLKRSAKLRGKKKPQGFGDMVRKVHTGRKFSDEHRKNIGLASKGRIPSAETRKKNSIANSGKNNAAWKGYYVSPCGKMFETRKEAGEFANLSIPTVSKYAHNNIKGWKFIDKEML